MCQIVNATKQEKSLTLRVLKNFMMYTTQKIEVNKTVDDNYVNKNKFLDLQCETSYLTVSLVGVKKECGKWKNNKGGMYLNLNFVHIT